jgi:tetratricopeptide (TPR) repeat protein
MEGFASKEALYRHFIGSVNKIGRLRRNPMVVALFEKTSGAGRPTQADRAAAERIRKMLAGVLDEIVASAPNSERRRAERTRTIIMRCDLGGSAHKAVAAELGLSARQFYRERERAILSAGEAFELLLTRRYALHAVTLDAFAVALQQITALRNAGLAEHALQLAERLRGEDLRSTQRTALTCVHAELLAERYDYDGALTLLDGLEPHADVTLAYAHVYAAAGAVSCARRYAERAGDTAGGFDTLARALLLRCDLEVSRGSMADARRALDQAGRALSQMEYVPAELLAEQCMQECYLYALDPADSPAMLASYNRGLQLSQRHGLANAAVNLTLAYSTYHSLQGRVEEAAQFARRALDLAELIPSAQYGPAYLIAAEAEIAAKRFEQAAAFVSKARGVLRPDGRDFARAQMLEAQIQCSSGRFREAVAAGKSAAELSQRADCPRFAGASLRIVAEAYAGMNRLREARANIDDALSILESRGHGHSLGRARQVAARLARSHRGVRNAVKTAIDVPQ